MENNENLLSSDLNIDGLAELHLKESAKWAKFLGIMGFIMSILILIIAFVIPSRMSQFSSSSAFAGLGGAMTGVITITYVIIAIIIFAVSFFVHKFGTNTQKALLHNDQTSLNEGFLNLKRLFRFYGVITIIWLAFMALAFIGGILTAMMR